MRVGAREIKFKQCHLSNCINECFPSKFSSKVCLDEGSFVMVAHVEAPTRHVLAARLCGTDAASRHVSDALGSLSTAPSAASKFPKIS